MVCGELKDIYFIYKAPNFQPAHSGCVTARVCSRAVFVLPTSLLMEAQVEFVAKAGLCKDELNTEVLTTVFFFFLV